MIREILSHIVRCLAVLPVFIVFSSFSCDAKSTHELTIGFTSDIHGWISSDLVYPDKKKYGLLYISDAIRKARESKPEMILIDAGDMIQGSPLMYFYTHETRKPLESPFYKMVSELNYDAIAVGNHDIGISSWEHNELFNDDRLPWISANLYSKSAGKTLAPPYRVVFKGGLKVAIMGFTTSGVHIWMNKPQKTDLKIDPVEKSVKKWIGLLKVGQKPDIIIGVFHVGLNPLRDNENQKLAGVNPKENLIKILEKNQDFDLVVSGHDHRLSPNRSGQSVKYLSGIPVVEPGSLGRSFVLMNISVDKNKHGSTIQDIHTKVIKADQNKLITDKYRKNLPEGYLSYINEETLYRVTTTSQEKADLCLNELVASSLVDSKTDGSLMPYLRWKNLKWYFGTILKRRDLFRLIIYDNRFASVKLSRRDLSLLTIDQSIGSKGYLLGRKIHISGEVEGIKESENAWFFPKKTFQRDLSFVVSDYHLAGGGGVLSKILYFETGTEDISDTHIRSRVFEILSSDQKNIPQDCRFLEKRRF